MPKIIVQRKTYASSSPHSDEIKRVVQEDLIANQLSEATNVAASVGLVNSMNSDLKKNIDVSPLITTTSIFTIRKAVRNGNVVEITGVVSASSVNAEMFSVSDSIKPVSDYVFGTVNRGNAISLAQLDRGTGKATIMSTISQPYNVNIIYICES